MPGDSATPTLELHRVGEGSALLPSDEMLASLDGVERARAYRYATSEHAASFITGRYLLRRLAARVVDAEAADLLSAFRCPVCGQRDAPPDHGQPGYTLRGERIPVALSLSRTSDLLLLGALDMRAAPRASEGRAPRIGVDLDAVAGVVFDGFDDVALSPAERHAVAQLPEADQDLARARLWVRKEAAVKAMGVGFSASGPSTIDAGSYGVVTDLPECDGLELGPLGLVAAVAVL